MIRLALNTNKFNTYAFFCPVSRLHVTVSNPIGSVDRVTPAILRALKSKTILDVDGVIDITTSAEKASNGKEKAPETPEKQEVPVNNETPAADTQKPVQEGETPEQPAEPKAEDTGDKKQRGKRAATNPVDDAAEK